MSDHDTQLKAARKHVKKLKDFYSHLSAYVIVNAGLGLIMAVLAFTGAERLFYLGITGFLLTIVGWGMGLAFHAWDVFEGQIFGRDWEERKVAELMNQAPPKRKHTPTESKPYFDADEDEASLLKRLGQE